MANVISNWIVSDLNNEKLTEQNYDVWSRKVQFLLEDQELLEPIKHSMEPPPSPEDNTDMIQYQKELEGYNAWKKKSRAARMILLISMRSDLMLRFDCHQTAKEVWDAVKGSFDRSPLVRMRQLQLSFASYKMKPNHTIAEHIAAMSDMIHELNAAGYVLNDEQQVQAMIRSIPDDQSWDLIKQKIICDVNIQTFEDVAGCLMLEGEKLVFKKPLNEANEVRLECSPVQLKTGSAKKRTRAQVNQSGYNDYKKTEPSVGKTKKSKKEKLLCFCCRRSGHLAKDCSIACYNCQQRGHGYKDCPEREVLTPTKAKTASKSEVYVGWTKPEKGWVKVNTDGAVQDSQGLAASGGVIRDDNGYWVTGFVQNMDLCSIQMAEMWGVLHGLQLAWDRGFRRVIIEMDCENCCALLGQDVLPNHALHNLLRQCQDYLRRDWTVQYRHVYRESNRLADYVCSLAFSFPVGFHVLNEPPLGSAPFVLDDMRGILTPRNVET